MIKTQKEKMEVNESVSLSVCLFVTQAFWQEKIKEPFC